MATKVRTQFFLILHSPVFLANLSMYQELLSEGSKFEITREYQELRTIITEARKFDLLISEIFVDSTRPCMTRDELSSLCTKVLNLPFKLKNSDLLIKVRFVSHIVDNKAIFYRSNIKWTQFWMKFAMETYQIQFVMFLLSAKKVSRLT